jgi:hypothetical protein
LIYRYRGTYNEYRGPYNEINKTYENGYIVILDLNKKSYERIDGTIVIRKKHFDNIKKFTYIPINMNVTAKKSDYNYKIGNHKADDDCSAQLQKEDCMSCLLDLNTLTSKKFKAKIDSYNYDEKHNVYLLLLNYLLL